MNQVKTEAKRTNNNQYKHNKPNTQVDKKPSREFRPKVVTTSEQSKTSICTTTCNTFLASIGTIVDDFKKVIEDSGYAVAASGDKAINVTVRKDTKKNSVGSCSATIEIVNPKTGVTAVIVIFYTINIRSNQKSLLIINGVSHDIIFSSIRENVLDAYQKYLSDTLIKSFKSVSSISSTPQKNK